MMTRRPQIVRAGPSAECGFGGDQDFFAPPGDGLPQDCFGESVGINISGIEKIHASVEADIHEPSRLGDIALTPGTKKIVSPTKRARAKTQHRYFQTRASQRSEFHASIDAPRASDDAGSAAEWSQTKKAARRRPEFTTISLLC